MKKGYTQKPKSLFDEYLLIIVGAIITAAGIYFFRFPNNFSTGGVTGLAVILQKLIPFSATQITSVLNVVLLIVGFIFLGKSFSYKTIVGTVVFSFVLLILENLKPMPKPFTDEPLLELCFAVLIPSIGTAIMFNNDGSTGGTDILAMIIRKYAKVEIGTAIMISDFAIALFSFTYGFKTGLYSSLGLLVKVLLIDSIMDSINLCKCFNIITDHPHEICEFIKNDLRRGATIFETKGAYHEETHSVIMTVMKRHQARVLREYIKKNYPDSFMVVTSSSEIIGRGFMKQ